MRASYDLHGGRIMAVASRVLLERLPDRYALAISGGYLLLGGAYIAFSDAFVSHLVSSVEAAERIQTLKGWGFIVVTAATLFGFSRALFRRLTEKGAKIAKQEESFHLLERRALAGALASAVAHDGNNMLTIVKSTATELVTRPEPDVRALAEDLNTATDHLIDMMRRLRDLGCQTRSQDARSMDLVDEARGAVARIQRHEHMRSCAVSVVERGPVWLMAYPVLIEELLINLVLNAAEAPSRTVEVCVEATTGGAIVTVSDDGPGVPPALRDRIFEPFFTSKPQGTGLGLLSVRGCADAHGGTVALDRSELGGSRFTVTLKSVG